KERTLMPVCAAPVLVPAGNSYEIARPDPLLASLVLVHVSALENHDPEIVRVRVHPRVESRHELGKRAVGPLVMVTPDNRLGNAWSHVLEGCLVCGDENQCFLSGLSLLALRESDRSCNGSCSRYSHNRQCSF